MDELRLNRRLEGISEVRDESDRTGLRIVVELKKEVDAEGILNYLFKNTDLQINYNFNMVAIHKLRPEQVGLKTVLDAYIDHRKDVIRKRSEFDLKKAKNRQHIVSGLIKALSILDQVIATIRGSKDKKDAKMNLVKEYDFTEEQAEAIVSLQLYRLTNTDITALEKESKELSELIAKLQLILNNEKELLNVMKTELREVKKQYKTPRLTKLEDEIAEITIETAVLIPQEDVMVSITKEGYAKRSSLRSYSASKEDTIEMKETDRLIFSSQLNTHDHLLIVTNKGNMIYRPVHELIDKRWKDVGEHFSLSITSLGMGENIVAVFPYSEISQTKQFVFVTKEGMIKRTQMKEFDVWRTYKSRPTLCIKLKTDTDEIIAADLIEENSHKDVLLVTNMAFGLYYDLDEVPVVGARAAGVKSINLKADDFVVDGLILERGEDVTITIVTQRGSIKRMKVSELSKLGRAKRGLMVLRELKSNPHRVFSVVKNQDNKMIHIVAENNKVYQVNYKDLPINDRQSNGSFIIDEKQDGSVKEVFTEIIE